MKFTRNIHNDIMNISIEKFRNGDVDVFRRLFTFLFPVLCSFASKFLHPAEAPEDIVQDAFIELWNRRPEFSGLDHIKSFLYLTIKNKCLNRIKHRDVEDRYVQEQNNLRDKTEFFEDQLLKAEIVLHLKGAIDKLPAQQRKIMLLNMMGHTNDEIAGTLDISVNTVKLQKKVAYEKLRNAFKNMLYSIIV